MLLIFISAYYLPQNVGDIARNYIKDPQLLSFIDAEVGYYTVNYMSKFLDLGTHDFPYSTFKINFVGFIGSVSL